MKRNEALRRLRATLTEQQKNDLRIVINGTEADGEYHFDGEGERWRESVDLTLRTLAWELTDFDVKA